MVEKVRKRGKKPSKLRKIEGDQAQKVASSSSLQQATQQEDQALDTEADFIPLDGGGAEEDADQSTHKDEEADTPNWVRLQDRTSKAEQEAPFGYVDVDVKAYFRAGWERVIELEEQGYSASSSVLSVLQGRSSSPSTNDASPSTSNEDDELALLLQATLKEMDGKELCLTTDPDTSLIVEGVLLRLPSKPLRVFVDRLAGNFALLAKHRFASHVVQACLSALQAAITLDHLTDDHLIQHSDSSTANGSASKTKHTTPSSSTIVNEDGILRSATQLLLDISQEISASLENMVQDAFGSHVLRTMLSVLSGRNVLSSAASTSSAADPQRSKRSLKFRSKKGPNATASSAAGRNEDVGSLPIVIPRSLLDRAKELMKGLLESTPASDIRKWTADTVASPLLQLMMELEAEDLGPTAKTDTDLSAWKGSLVDIVLDDMISDLPASSNTTGLEGEDKASSRKPHLESSLRDSIASHVLQKALSYAPDSCILQFFQLYIQGRMGKLCIHPSANHIVATLIRRLGLQELEGKVLPEMAKVGTSMVKENMIGCLIALVERVIQLTATDCNEHGQQQKGAKSSNDERREVVLKKISDVVVGASRLKLKSFDAQDEKEEVSTERREQDLKLLVPTILSLKTRKAYLHTYAKIVSSQNGNGKVDTASGGSNKRARDGKLKGKSKGRGKNQNKDEKIVEDGDNDDDDNEAQEWDMQAAHQLSPATEVTVQGSLLLQALLRLPGSSDSAAASNPSSAAKAGRNSSKPAAKEVHPYGSTLVLESLLRLPTATPFAVNATAVHILLLALQTPPSPIKRKLCSQLIDQIPDFCGDKYGSRLADQVWYTADGFQKEKLVKLVIANNTKILKGAYATFFTNKLNLGLYRKGKFREWSEWAKSQQQPKDAASTPNTAKSVTGAPLNRFIVEDGTQHQQPDNGKDRKKSKSKSTNKSKLDGELDEILKDL